ncbi:hypothetical protein LLG10_05275 [bacterium]|nr:hypothetical protein [bacterium]
MIKRWVCFIIQATYGEKASDYYLFSLNTLTGELVKIHKGFHGAFLIKRNEFLKQFVAKLDTGWNPFSGFSFGKEKENCFQDAKSAWQMVKRIADVVPIFELDQVYPVLVIVMNEEVSSEDIHSDRTVLFLYNQNFELQHYYPIEVNDMMHDLASIFLPLPRENIIFTSYSHAPRYSACQVSSNSN